MFTAFIALVQWVPSAHSVKGFRKKFDRMAMRQFSDTMAIETAAVNRLMA
jgi:hypothetical protein